MTPSPAVLLVVDDEPLVLRYMERALRDAGYEVYAVSDAVAALELTRSLPVPPALLVSDVRMEPVDGPALAQLMAQASPSTRVLFVSGYPTDPAHPVVSGPILKKPFSPAQLVEAVTRILGTQ